MDYKKIIKSQRLRFGILSILRFIPSKLMVKIQYRIKLHRKLNLNNPKRWTEKLQLYKLRYRNAILKECSDKYLVRQFIESKGLKHILVDLYDVVNLPNEIDFDRLPDKFVIKTTHGSGTNIFCSSKSELNIDETLQTLKTWLKRDYYLTGREWAYKGIERKIIIEQLLVDNKVQNGIHDYKILCFHGNPKYIVVDVDRYTEHKRNIYDLNWNKIEVFTDYPNFIYDYPKPEKLNEMIEIAKILSKDFPFVRVDLYNVNSRIYFGELTFYPWTGYVQFTPDEFDFILGLEF